MTTGEKLVKPQYGWQSTASRPDLQRLAAAIDEAIAKAVAEERLRWEMAEGHSLETAERLAFEEPPA